MTYKLLLFATRIPGLLTVESDQDTEESRLRRLYLRWCSERGGGVYGEAGPCEKSITQPLYREQTCRHLDDLNGRPEFAFYISPALSRFFCLFFIIWACKAVAYRLGNTVLRPFVLLIVF